jgi:DNA-binding transcriptional LysR family regulator
MIDFRKLEAFCKVYELKSFSQAGKELFLSQPTISAHVLSLEKELEVQLLDRMGRMVLPTAAGEVLYQYARQAFASIEAAKAEITQLQDEITGHFVVGGSTIPAHYLIPPIISGFMKRHPGVTMELKVGDSSRIIEMVSEGELTLGIVGAQDSHPELAYTPVIDDELVFIAPTDMFPDGTSLSSRDLGRYPWIMRESGSGTRKSFTRVLADKGVDVRRFTAGLTVDSTQAVLQCVKAGLGVSMTSRLAVTDMVDRGELRIIPLTDVVVRRQFYCVHHAKRHFFPAVSGFILYLKEKTKLFRNA